VVAVAAVVLAVGLGGGGSPRTALAPQVAPCVRRFLSGTAANETLILGLANRFPRAGIEGKPVGLVLGLNRPVGGLRFVHHLQPSEYFEVQGALDAVSCSPARVTDLTNPAALPDALPYDDLRVDLTGRPYYVRLGVANGREMEAGFHARRPAES
jgi:hypothetical protein